MQVFLIICLSIIGLGILTLFVIWISCFFVIDKFLPIQYIMINEKFLHRVNTKIENWLLQYCLDHSIPVAYQIPDIISYDNICSGIVSFTITYNKEKHGYYYDHINELLVQYRNEKQTDYHEWCTLSHEIGHTLICKVGNEQIKGLEKGELLADQYGGQLVIDNCNLTKLELYSIEGFLRHYCKLDVGNNEQQWKLFTRKEKKEMYIEYMKWKKENNDENKIEAKESN